MIIIFEVKLDLPEIKNIKHNYAILKFVYDISSDYKCLCSTSTPPPFVGIIFSLQILKTGSTQFCKQFIFWNILFEKQSAHKSQFINLPDVVVP